MANKADAEGSTQTDNRTGKARATAWSRDRADKEAAYFVAKYVDDPRPFQADKLFCYITGVELDTSPAMRTDGSGRLDRTTFHHDNDSRPSLDTIYPFYMLPDGTVVSHTALSVGLTSLRFNRFRGRALPFQTAIQTAFLAVDGPYLSKNQMEGMESLMKLYRAQNHDCQPPCRWESRVELGRKKYDGMLLLDKSLRDLFEVRYHGKSSFPKALSGAQLCSVAREAGQKQLTARSAPLKECAAILEKYGPEISGELQRQGFDVITNSFGGPRISMDIDESAPQVADMLVHMIQAMKASDKGKKWSNGLTPFGVDSEGREVPRQSLILVLYKNIVYAFFKMLKRRRGGLVVPVMLTSYHFPGFPMTAVYDYAHYAFMGCGSRINHNLPHRLGFSDLSDPERLKYIDFDPYFNNVVLDASCINTALGKSVSERDIVQMQLALHKHGLSFLKRNWFLEEAISNGLKVFEDEYNSAWQIFNSVCS